MGKGRRESVWVSTLFFAALVVALSALSEGGWCGAGTPSEGAEALQRVPGGAGSSWDVAITEKGLEKVQLGEVEQFDAESRLLAGERGEPKTTSCLDWIQGLPFANRPLKLYVDTRGIYRVEMSALLDSGFDWRGVPCSAVRLFCQGKQVPIWVDDRNGNGVLDEEDAVEFWGEPYRPPSSTTTPDIYYSNYTRVNAYWLVETSAVPPKRLVALPGNPTTQPAYRPRWFPWTEHFEKDKHFFRLGRVPYPLERDHWFWGRISGGHLQSFRFELPWPDTTTAMIVKVKACLHGRTYGDLGQHAARLVLGTQDVGQVLHWRDQDLLVTETSGDLPLYADALRPGENELSVLNLNPDEANEILFNWFELTYPRQYRAWEDELEFTVPEFAVGERVRFQLEGFTTEDVDVYKIGVGKFFGLRREKIQEETQWGIEESWQIELEDEVASADVRYVAVARDKKRVPRAIRAAAPPILWAPAGDMDYVIVAPDSFLKSPAMDSLVTLRQKAGLRVWRVSTESIYDNFNWGVYSPVAIQRFTHFMLREWPQPPEYLLLVGNARRGRESFANPGVLVPSLLVQTVKYGALPSDNQFAVRSEVDAHPEIAVGRLPVASLAELSLVVQKLWRYETQSEVLWRNRVLMIAGRNDVFKRQTQTILENRWDRAFDLRRLDATPSRPPFLGTSADLIDFWNDGAGLINFMGHGGGRVWADARMLTFDEVPKIENGDKLPFVTSMTCFTAAFEAGPQCLGNALLLHSKGGAIGVLGSAGLGWIWNDYYLLNELVRALQDTTVHTLGEAVRVAKTRYYDRFGSSLATTMVNQYTLLGDPATPILLPRKKIEATAVKEGPGRVRLAASTGIRFLRAQLLWPNFLLPFTEYELGGKSEPQSLLVPEPAASQPESLAVRFVGLSEHGSTLVHGFANVAMEAGSIDSVWWDPARPVEGDSVQFWIAVSGLEGNVEGEVRGSIPLQVLPLVRTVDPRVWKSSRRISFLTPGDYAVTFSFRSPESGALLTRTLRFSVETRSPVKLRWNSFGIGEHRGVTVAVAEITNQTGRRQTVVAKMSWRSAEEGDWHALGADTLRLEPFATGKAEVPWLLPFGDFDLKVEVLDLEDNVLTRAERRQASPYLQANHGNWINVPGPVDSVVVGDFLVKPCAGWSGTVSIARHSLPPQAAKQGGLILASPSALQVSQVGEERPCLNVRFTQHVSGGKTRFQLCRYDSSLGVWTRLGTDGTDWAVLTHSSVVAWFQTGDSTGPVIRLLSRGRPLFHGCEVSPGADIEIVVSDPNGLAPVEDWSVQIDGETVRPREERGRVVYSSSVAVLKIQAPKQAGEHQLGIRVPDALGNLSDLLDFEFRISGKQELTFLGNFPNPFRDRTVFAFRTSQGFERFSLQIFSTSGRTVRVLGPNDSEDPNLYAAGYHEITWDGKDGEGRSVGYGVYFFKLSVLSSDRWLTQVGKVARVP